MLKYLLPLVLFAPLPVFAQYERNCVRVLDEYVPGHYDYYGNWIPGGRRITRIPYVCSSPRGYFPDYIPVPEPRYYPPAAPICGKSTLDILGIPIIGSTNVCQ